MIAPLVFTHWLELVQMLWQWDLTLESHILDCAHDTTVSNYLSLYCGNDGVTVIIAMMELEFIVNILDLINLIDMKYAKHAF